jgi:glutamine amidotransferase
MKIAVVDYGMGNLRSVSKALEQVAPKAEVMVTSLPAQIASADRVVFPGQGAMPDCMRELDARHLRQAVTAAAASKPFLGICIGLQMLFDRSEEGDVAGLGILSGSVRRFPEARMREANGMRLKVPHMGWNRVEQRNQHALWAGIPDGDRYYFVHSYYACPADEAVICGETDYGLRFVCAVARDNIFAVQFHPEKSAGSGLRLLANFINWNP